MPSGGSELVLANKSPPTRLYSPSLGAWVGFGGVDAWIQVKARIANLGLEPEMGPCENGECLNYWLESGRAKV